MPDPRLWTSAETDYLLRRYTTDTLRAIAAHLGKDEACVSAKFQRLAKQGRAHYGRRAYQPRWTEDQDHWLREHLGRDGWGYRAAAGWLKRSEGAVKARAAVLGMRKPMTAPIEKTLGLADVMRVMGLGANHGKARGWFVSRVLKASRSSACGKRKRWVIYRADFVEFLQQHPEAYEYDRIPPIFPDGSRNPWRQWAKRQDPTAGFWTCKELARRAGVCPEYIHKVIRDGRLPGATHLAGPGIDRREWFVPVAAGRAWMRERAARRPLRALVVERVGLPVPAVVSEAAKGEIAAEAAVTLSAVRACLSGLRREAAATERRAA